MIRIVAVDDEPAFAELLGLFLKGFGDFEIITYTSPKEALEHLFSDNADAIISDYTMNEMDGITLFNELKARNLQIPFLLLTARDDSKLVLQAMNAGIDFVQFKSDDPSILFTDIAQKIRNAVGKYRAQQEVQKGIKQREFLILLQRDLMNRLTLSSTLNQASDTCLTSIRNLINCQKGSIHLFNQSSNKIELLIAHNLPDIQLKRFTYGNVYKVIFSGLPIYFSADDPETQMLITGGQIPIFGGDRVIGVLSFILDRPQPANSDTRDTIELLVSLLGNTLLRIKSEEMVRNRQEELNELYNAMEELVVVIDMDGAILNVNPAVTRTLGYQENELLGEPIHILYPPDIRDQIVFQFLDLTGSGGKVNNNYPLLTRNGISIPVETRGTIGNWAGRHVLFCISREISERLKAEQSLHEYFERLQAILSSSTAQIYMKDAQLRYITANNPFMDFVKVKDGVIDGLTDTDLFSQPIAEQKKLVDAKIISEDIPVYNIEEEIASKEGTPIWLVTSKIPTHDQKGNVTGIVGTSLDVTSLVQTRQELQKQDRILSAVSSLGFLLVRSTDWESLIPKCLSLLGEATETEIVFFSRINENDGIVTSTISNVWWRENPSESMREIIIKTASDLIVSNIEELKKETSIHGFLNDIHKEVPNDLSNYALLSYLVFPINTSESVWGGLGFFSYKDRKTTPAEIDSLITASGIIGSVIERTQTEELFHKPVERSLVGIYLVQDEKFMYLNPRMSDILGYPRVTLEMMPYTLCFHPDDTHEAITRHQRIIETPNAHDDYEIRAIRADGRIIFLENLLSQFTFQGKPAVIGSIMDITARKESEVELRHSLHEKEILLREVHHRVKNNMQIIVSMLRMQLNTIDDPKMVEILQESKNRILSMAMIHEKLYRTDSLITINLLEYVDTLASTIISDFSATESLITLDLVCDPTIEMTIDAGIPLGLIINELLTNSFKHGFSQNQKGTISIRVMHMDEDWLDIIYRDSGKGLPEGFILENCDSLGMQLIQNLVFQSSGEMNMTSDHGIVVTLRIPMNEGFLIGGGNDATRE